MTKKIEKKRQRKKEQRKKFSCTIQFLPHMRKWRWNSERERGREGEGGGREVNGGR